MLGPVWTEQHGVGVALDSLQDSITYDGWERVLSVVSRKNGVVMVRDTFGFDRLGNLRTTAGAEGYGAVTNRLLSRSTPAGTRYYGYDRAGKLCPASCRKGLG